MSDPKLIPLPQETLDSFFHGRIKVLQKKEGFRFSIDAPLLADFIRTRPEDDCLELGTGSGIISLLLSIKSFRHVTALELQGPLADMARRNIGLNGLDDRIDIVNEDFSSYSPKKKFDVVFSNPPYIEKGTGHLSPSEEKTIAKHEVQCSLPEVLDRTAVFLKKTGRAFFIYPAHRFDEFQLEASQRNLHVRTLRMVHSHKEKPPTFFLVELQKVPGPILEPYNAKGRACVVAIRYHAVVCRNGGFGPVGQRSSVKSLRLFYAEIRARNLLQIRAFFLAGQTRQFISVDLVSESMPDILTVPDERESIEAF